MINIPQISKSIGNFISNTTTQKLLGVAVAAWGVLKHYDPALVSSLGLGYTTVLHAIDSVWNSPKGTPPTA